MLQGCRDLDLSEETFLPSDAESSSRSSLTATLRSCLRSCGEEDRGHAALAQLPLDAVAVG